MNFKNFLAEAAADAYYHATLTKNADQIKEKGLTKFNASNWVKAASKERYGDGAIFAFENELDALRWAGKMDWEFNKGFGTGKVSIVKLRVSDPEAWKVDDADPLGQAGSKGRWMKSQDAVKATDIISITPVNAADIKRATK